MRRLSGSWRLTTRFAADSAAQLGAEASVAGASEPEQLGTLLLVDHRAETIVVPGASVADIAKAYTRMWMR